MSIWPPLIYIMLASIGLGIGFANYGKPRTITFDFSDIFANACIVALLWWGSFFEPILNLTH